MENPSILNHVSIGTLNYQRSTAFYDKVLATLGAVRVLEHDGAVAYGNKFPEFWIGKPLDGTTAHPGNGVHFSFNADSKEEVDSFHRVALENGGRDNGAPGPRPIYGDPYYGCFIIDPDGNKIEATFWDASLAGRSG